MAHKILAGILIAISSILLGLSIAGIALIWMYKEPLIQVATARLQSIDNDLAQAQTSLQNAELELQRTLRMVEAAEKNLETLKADFEQAKALFGVNGTLDKQLLPGLKASRGQIVQTKSSLQELRVTLEKINALPFLNLNIPGDKALSDLIANADSLDTQITQVEDLVKKASTFMGDASYLMGGDFTETKNNLQNFLVVVQEYDQKLGGWRAQLAMLIRSLPGWIETAATGLTIFLLWFAFSQYNLIVNGLSLWRGNDPQTKIDTQIVDDAQIESIPQVAEMHTPQPMDVSRQ
jgi:multidrug efflux pump subunit AcrA (membrane-fusion protein)